MTKRQFNAKIAAALRAATASAERKLARIQIALSGVIGVKHVWIKRCVIPKHAVRRHQRLVFYKIP